VRSWEAAHSLVEVEAAYIPVVALEDIAVAVGHLADSMAATGLSIGS
jgi:hypothetical protein